MQLNTKCGKFSPWLAAAIVAFAVVASPARSQAPANTGLPAPDLTKVPTLYEVGYSHLDTEWCWMYPQVINEFIGNTLHQNFALFDKYPDYVFNWTGANRYKFMKEYYPADYAKLKTYVAEGKWVTDGSSLEEGDVNIPSEESIVRQVLYGNEFFKKELHSSSTDFILPDCFGFPASLPSILAHCGLNGFSTQKLTWGSAVGIPFDLGVWVGPDNHGVFAALNAGNYTASLDGDVSKDSGWLDHLKRDGDKTGFFADYNYYGVGDRGGSVRDSDAANLEKSLKEDGPVHVISSRSDQVFNDLEKYNTSSLPRYKGDLLLTWHTSGSATSQAEMKRWNHENEKLADATERASVAADWLGALPYDKARITDGWWKFLPGQFHDLMAGTALPMAYEYAWNDQILALNEFSGQLQEAVGGVTRALDTEGGVPVVVYNPVSVERQDVVQASVTFPGIAPKGVFVFGPGDENVPSQIVGRSGNTITLLFLAKVASLSFSVYHVLDSTLQNDISLVGKSSLKVSESGLENARYRVQLNAGGDVTSIYDKKASKELLAAPLRLSFQHENPSQYPAWNMDYEDQMKPPAGYVDGPAKIKVVENGPVRVSVQVDRWANSSHFSETISLCSGSAGDQIDFSNSIDWQSLESALKVIMPLTVSNPMATYNWELGTVQRSTDDPKKYEVPSHQWFDLTDTSGAYGVTVLTGDRYGSDKPTDSELRLTLLYTPGVRAGYTHQKTNDWGHHDISYAIAGHSGDWVNGQSQWMALRFDRPLVAFQAPVHNGSLGTSFSFASVNNPNVEIEAMKQAEDSKQIVVRFNELAGKTESGVECKFAGRVVSAKEVNGQEAVIGNATVKDGNLVFDMDPYRPRAFAVTLATSATKMAAPVSNTVVLPFNVDVTKPFGSAEGGSFDAFGNAIPSDMLPSSIVSDGIRFDLNPSSSTNNAVECRGQNVSVPQAAHGAKLYILAASSAGDIPAATFTAGGIAQSLKIQAWNGDIGLWDDRVWGGTIPVLTYDMTNPLIGLNPGFIKRDTVAWYSDHYRHADGTNEAYEYCYLYRYSISLPSGARSVKLPNDPRIKVLAATVSDDPNAAITPAVPLYDTLIHSTNKTPHVDVVAAADGQSSKVTIEAPLYFAANSSMHYTLDGSEPSESSPTYADPFSVTEPAKIKAAYISLDGTVLGTSVGMATVANPTGPQITSITSPSSKVITLQFSEPVLRSAAENPANYTISPANSVSSAVLSADGEMVTLTATDALPTDQQSNVSVAGVQSALPSALPLAGNTTMAVPQPNIVFQRDAVETFDGTTDGFSTSASGLPLSAGSAWTINLYAYFDSTPDELTTLAGFGDDTDTSGAERYLLKFHDGIHFWASNVDVSSGVPYDLSKWQMVTATYDGSQLRLYKNGKLINTTAVTLSDAAPTVKIGPRGPWDDAGKLNGKIAGLRIWNSALSADQISALLPAMPAN